MTDEQAAEMRLGVLGVLNDGETPATESAKELADNILHVNYLLKAKPESWSAADREFISAEIRKCMANL